MPRAYEGAGPAQADDALVADRALIDRLASLTDDERAARLSLGPIDLDQAGFVSLRLNEHVLHTGDVEVTADRQRPGDRPAHDRAGAGVHGHAHPGQRHPGARRPGRGP